MIRVHSSLNEIFQKDTCNIGYGAVKINLRTCDVTFCPTMTIDNAAKLAAKTIYNAMSPDTPSSEEPEWLNKVSFTSEGFEQTPAIRVVDNRFWFNSPPFNKTKKNLNFWKHFTEYWYVMCVQSMKRALFNREKTAKEERLLGRKIARIEM